MREGYFIGWGDKTTCGGEVLEGDNRVKMFGVLHAREGDRVSCGKDGKIYNIIGGISYINSHGRLVAGTLDSISGCPCRAQLIPSIYQATYESQRAAPTTARQTAEPAPSTVSRQSKTPQQSGFAPSSNPVPVVFNRIEPQEPGFYVVPKSMSREVLESTLFPVRDPLVMSKFKALNPDRGEVKAGSIVVLSDPRNFQCSREESILMQAAAQANDALEPLTADEADFMQRHHEEIQSFLALGSTAIGVGEAMFARNLDDLKNILQQIEALHQKAFLKDGNLRSPEFFSERKRLLAQLDSRLTSLVRKGIGLPDHPDLKSALGISSRSLVHRWTQAGAPGQIPGYATHIQGISRAAKVIKYGGWIGTAVGGGASYVKVQSVCKAGDDEACEKVKFTETASFVGEVVGGAAASAALSGATVSGLCVALGVPTAGLGTLACGIVVVGTASLAGGYFGGKITETFAEKLYETTK